MKSAMKLADLPFLSCKHDEMHTQELWVLFTLAWQNCNYCTGNGTNTDKHFDLFSWHYIKNKSCVRNLVKDKTQAGKVACLGPKKAGWESFAGQRQLFLPRRAAGRPGKWNSLDGMSGWHWNTPSKSAAVFACSRVMWVEL